MPKYVIIGLAIPIILFILMNYWGKISDLTKNRILMVIFGIKEQRVLQKTFRY